MVELLLSRLMLRVMVLLVLILLLTISKMGTLSRRLPLCQMVWISQKLLNDEMNRQRLCLDEELLHDQHFLVEK